MGEIKKRALALWNGLFFEEKFMLVCVVISVACTAINVAVRIWLGPLR